MCRLTYVFHACGHWGESQVTDGCVLRDVQRQGSACSNSSSQGVIRHPLTCLRCQRVEGLYRRPWFARFQDCTDPEPWRQLNRQRSRGVNVHTTHRPRSVALNSVQGSRTLTGGSTRGRGYEYTGQALPAWMNFGGVD